MAGPDVFVHPLGVCESHTVGIRTRIWAFAHVMAGAVIGDDCNICDHAFVESGSELGNRVTVKNGVMVFCGVSVGDDVFLGPGVVFTNDLRPRATIKRAPHELATTRVETGATLGARVVVVCGTTIGEHSFVAAGAVVTHDVAPFALVIGTPARRVAWCCVCGDRLPVHLGCTCGRTYDLVSEEKGLVPSLPQSGSTS